MKRLIYGALGICVLTVCLSFAAPKPAVIPGPSQWTIDTEFTHPQQIVMRRTSNNAPVVFWYTIITLTNKTGEDVGLYPKCDLMTDTFQIIPEGKYVSSVVFEQIKARHQSRYSFLKPLGLADNKLLQGEDNTQDIAVIWPDFDKNAKNITLFITGLSNETAVIDHPVAKDENGQPLKVFLKKTLELKYDVKGDTASRYGVNLVFKSKRWIMR